MDRQHLLFARSRGIGPHGILARRIALASAATGLALFLSGCDAQRVDKLEERVNLVEAKADAADKRAKTAESLATQTQPVVQPEAAPQNDLDPSADDAADAPGDNGGNDAPPPPMADNGKG